MRKKLRQDWGEKEYDRVQKEDQLYHERLRAAGQTIKVDYADDRALRQCLGLPPKEESIAALEQVAAPPSAGKKRVIKPAKGARRAARSAVPTTDGSASIQGTSGASERAAEVQPSPSMTTTTKLTTPTAVSNTPASAPTSSQSSADSEAAEVQRSTSKTTSARLTTSTAAPTTPASALTHSQSSAVAETANGGLSSVKATPARFTRASSRKRKMGQQATESTQNQKVYIVLKLNADKAQNQPITTPDSTTTPAGDEATRIDGIASSGPAQEKIFLKLRMNAGMAQQQPVDENVPPSNTSPINTRKRPAANDHDEQAPATKKHRTVLKPMSANITSPSKSKHKAPSSNTAAESTNLLESSNESTSHDAGDQSTDENSDFPPATNASWPSMVQSKPETSMPQDQPLTSTVITKATRKTTKTKTTKKTKTTTTSSITISTTAPTTAPTIPQTSTNILPQSPARLHLLSPKQSEGSKKKKSKQAQPLVDEETRAAHAAAMAKVPRIVWSGDETRISWTIPEKEKRAQALEDHQRRVARAAVKAKTEVPTTPTTPEKKKKVQPVVDQEKRAAHAAAMAKVPRIVWSGDETRIPWTIPEKERRAQDLEDHQRRVARADAKSRMQRVPEKGKKRY